MPNKYKQVKVNFKLDQFEKLEEFANKKGISKAEWIRNKIGATFEEARQPTRKPQEKVVSQELLYELRKIGGNINQLAKRANIDKALDRQILSSLVRIEKNLKRLYDS